MTILDLSEEGRKLETQFNHGVSGVSRTLTNPCDSEAQYKARLQSPASTTTNATDVKTRTASC